MVRAGFTPTPSNRANGLPQGHANPPKGICFFTAGERQQATPGSAGTLMCLRICSNIIGMLGVGGKASQ